MNVAAIPPGLQHSAAWQPADLAAVELLARHSHFLHLPQFRRLIATASSVFTGEPILTIRWQAEPSPPWKHAGCPAPVPSGPC